MLILMLAAAAAIPDVRGDFDHDGRMDTAHVDHIGSVLRLSVRRGAAPKRPLTVYTADALSDFYVDKVHSGIWKTACAKKLIRDRCPEKQVTLRGNTLGFGVRGKSEAVAPWTGRGFRVVWTTD